jgi:hypothetical protein
VGLCSVGLRTKGSYKNLMGTMEIDENKRILMSYDRTKRKLMRSLGT